MSHHDHRWSGRVNVNDETEFAYALAQMTDRQLTFFFRALRSSPCAHSAILDEMARRTVATYNERHNQ